MKRHRFSAPPLAPTSPDKIADTLCSSLTGIGRPEGRVRARQRNDGSRDSLEASHHSCCCRVGTARAGGPGGSSGRRKLRASCAMLRHRVYSARAPPTRSSRPAFLRSAVSITLRVLRTAKSAFCAPLLISFSPIALHIRVIALTRFESESLIGVCSGPVRGSPPSDCCSLSGALSPFPLLLRVSLCFKLAGLHQPASAVASMTSHVNMSPEIEAPERLQTSERLLRMPRLSDLSSRDFWIGDYVSPGQSLA